MIRIAFLCSGSKGNATLVSNGETLLLFDMGTSKATLSKGCALFGKKIEDIAAEDESYCLFAYHIFIT